MVEANHWGRLPGEEKPAPSVPAHCCRVMETRQCPPSLCIGTPCARFESDDPTPWLTPDEIAKVRRHTAAEIVALFGVPAVMGGPEVLDEALRELLSYCRTQAAEMDRYGEDERRGTYNDVADRLAKILDGES